MFSGVKLKYTRHSGKGSEAGSLYYALPTNGVHLQKKKRSEQDSEARLTKVKQKC